MQNQIHLQRGEAVFVEGMYYYYPLGRPVNAVHTVGPTFRQHQTTRLIRNQVSLPSRIIDVSIVPFDWSDPLKTKAGK